MGLRQIWGKAVAPLTRSTPRNKAALLAHEGGLVDPCGAAHWMRCIKCQIKGRWIMPKSELRNLLDQIIRDAVDERIDDATFRRRARRAAKRIERAFEQVAAAAPSRPGSRSKRARAKSASGARYKFVAVPNGRGGMTSVSIPVAVFDELADSLGGDAKVTALARKVATGYRPESGAIRSGYVLRHLRRHAQKAATR